MFDDERAINECVGYIEKIWHHEKFIGGGYSAIATMNTISQAHFDTIYEPEGEKLYFACSELAEKWDGQLPKFTGETIPFISIDDLD